jgi:hypothetical protein
MKFTISEGTRRMHAKPSAFTFVVRIISATECNPPVVFPLNSYVLVDHATPVIPVGHEIKLRSYKKCPMKIVGHDGNTYRVRDTFTNREYHVNVIRLTMIVYDPARVEPEIVALRDHNPFIVDSILGIRDEGPKANWEVKVSWKGYGPEHDSWIPWDDAKDFALLNAYLREHMKAKKIPKKHTAKG